jgi:hypothetical protein
MVRISVPKIGILTGPFGIVIHPLLGKCFWDKKLKDKISTIDATITRRLVNVGGVG